MPLLDFIQNIQQKDKKAQKQKKAQEMKPKEAAPMMKKKVKKIAPSLEKASPRTLGTAMEKVKDHKTGEMVFKEGKDLDNWYKEEEKKNKNQ